MLCILMRQFQVIVHPVHIENSKQFSGMYI